MTARRSPGGRPRTVSLDTDRAFLVLLIAAMDASGHASTEEAARAHDIVWSMRRFRGQSEQTVGRKIHQARRLLEGDDAEPVIGAACRKIPARLRPSAFAVAADIALVDGRMQRTEAQFLRRLSAEMNLDRATANGILDVIRLKNRA